VCCGTRPYSGRDTDIIDGSSIRADVTKKLFVARADVREEFSFLVTPLSLHYEQ
jgi:hypothetical protein